MTELNVTMLYGATTVEPTVEPASSAGLCASGSYESSTTEKTTITTGFKPRYICIVGTHTGGQMIIYDESLSDTTFRFAGTSTYASTRNLGTNTNYNLYSVNEDGFTVNKTTRVYTCNWFAIG